MLEVYALNVKMPLKQKVNQLFLEQVSKERVARIARFKRVEDGRRTLMGEILIKAMLSKHLNKPVKEIAFLNNAFGKPYLPNDPFYFNVSHSGNWVVGAISTVPIGIDIEKIKQSDLGIARRFFTYNEYQAICHRSDETLRNQSFYLYWSGKESYIKMIGKGLTIPLDAFELDFSKEKLVLQKPYENQKGYFQIYPIDVEAYSCVLCSEVPYDSLLYKQVDYDVLYEALKL